MAISDDTERLPRSEFHEAQRGRGYGAGAGIGGGRGAPLLAPELGVTLGELDLD